MRVCRWTVFSATLVCPFVAEPPQPNINACGSAIDTTPHDPHTHTRAHANTNTHAHAHTQRDTQKPRRDETNTLVGLVCLFAGFVKSKSHLLSYTPHSISALGLMHRTKLQVVSSSVVLSSRIEARKDLATVGLTRAFCHVGRPRGGSAWVGGGAGRRGWRGVQGRTKGFKVSGLEREEGEREIMLLTGAQGQSHECPKLNHHCSA